MYGECHSDCENSCHHIEDKSFCSEECVGGCQCSEGTYLDNDFNCVSRDECPCFNKYDAMRGLIPPGETISLNCANW